MDLAQYRRINTIIERDSADATYKYALLRGVIEICQQSSHHFHIMAICMYVSQFQETLQRHLQKF